MNIRKIYEYALAREYEGKRFFEQNAERLSHAAAKSAFKQLAMEEQKHIEFIQSQLDAINHGKVGSHQVGIQLEQSGFFTSAALSDNLEQLINESMVPDLPVLRMAYLIERDFAEFYAMAASKVEGEPKLVLEMLARWEHGHELLFKQYHDQAFEQYSQMPWGG